VVSLGNCNTVFRVPDQALMFGSQPNVLDSIITKLLVTTKQLLQGLEQWSQGVISEEDVSVLL
jgi:hypothetical protein